MIAAHGPTGQLMDLLARDATGLLATVKAENAAATLLLTEQQCCDLELLMNGGFSPLAGFMRQDDYHAVRDRCRLMDGTVWPMPLPLRVAPAVAQPWRIGQSLALLDPKDRGLLAILQRASSIDSKPHLKRWLTTNN